LTVRHGREQGYRAAHRAVWPELIEEARRAGIRNHSVFMAGRTLFVYFEADDVEKSMAALRSNPVKARWDEYMREFLEPDVCPLEEVFYMS
jgi:L-rhamnose mutarotase